MRKVLFYCTVISGLLFLSGCGVSAQTRVVLTPQEISQLEFKSDDGLLENPPKDKARIYIVRSWRFSGVGLGSSIGIEFDPVLNEKGEPSHENYQDVLCYMKAGAACYADIKPDIPINLSAMTERATYVQFTPKKGNIYCFESSIVKGYVAARPNITPIDEKTCNEIMQDIKWEKSMKYQEKWRKKYLKKGKRTLPEDMVCRAFEDC